VSSDILYDVDGGVATVTLNRPDKLNSFTTPMLQTFNERLGEAASDIGVRAVLLTGAGRAFCAGQDLGDRAVRPGEEPPDLGESLELRYNPAIRAMRAMPKPIVVAVNGVAAGAGANIALAGDIVLGARSARFIQAFSKIGLIPDSGGTFVLPRAVGAPRALAVSMLAEPITADVAEDWGMIWKAVDDEDLADTASTLAGSLAGGPTAGFAALKEAMNASLGNSLDEQLDLERDLQQALGRSDDYREGVAAFLDKRPPRYSGR
jgi:2-(1,2-epoxy-1,2-dihydrophenyl)acetyl-CoA isomerase